MGDPRPAMGAEDMAMRAKWRTKRGKGRMGDMTAGIK